MRSPGCHPKPLRAARRKLARLPMLHHHALGPAGRARGEDDVGRVVRTGDGLLHRRRILAFKIFAGQQDRPRNGERVLHHHLQPRPGRIGIQRHEDAAGLPDGEDRHRQVQRALQQDAHRNGGPDAAGTETAGQPVRPPVELSVRQLLPLEDDRHRLGRHPGPVPEPEMQGEVVEGLAGVVPLVPELVPLAVVQQGEIAHAAVRISRDPVQEDHPMLHETPHRRRVEQVRRVAEHAGHALGDLDEVEPEVERRRAGVHVQRLHLDAGDARVRARGRSEAGTSPGRAAGGPGRAPAPAPRPAPRTAAAWWAYAPSATSRTRPSSSREAAGRRRGSSRSTRVLTKKPTSPSISARSRLATGEPTTTSSWPP